LAKNAAWGSFYVHRKSPGFHRGFAFV